MRPIKCLLAAALATLAMSAVFAAAASADDCTGNFCLSIDNAVLDLGSTTGVKAIDSENGDPPATLDGNIDGSGNINVPTSGFVFPEKNAEVSPGITATINMDANEPITGDYDAATGKLDLDANLKATIDVLGSTCTISPVQVSLSTDGYTPYLGEAFTSGLSGPGAVDGSWTSLPPVTGGGSCSIVGGLIAGPGGIWMAQQLHDPKKCADEPTHVGCNSTPVTCGKNQYKDASGNCKDYIPCSDGRLVKDQSDCGDFCTSHATDPKCLPKPELSLKVTPKAKKVKAGKKVVIKAKVTNSGDAAGSTKVCVKGPKKKVKVPKCTSVNVGAGKSVTKKLKVKLTKKARGKVKLHVTASGAGSGKVTLKVKKAKKHGKKHKGHHKHKGRHKK